MCASSMPKRLRGGLPLTPSSFLHGGPTACGETWLRERSRATLQRHDGSERFAAAAEAAAIDRRCDPREGGASHARVEAHLDQLHQIVDASTQLQRHGEHRPSAARTERGRAAPGFVECDLRITRRRGAPPARAGRRLGATRRHLGALVGLGGRGRVSGDDERLGRLRAETSGGESLPPRRWACTTRGLGEPSKAPRIPRRTADPPGR